MSLAPALLTALILLCFSPMFLIHEKRLRLLRGQELETADQAASAAFRLWKQHVRKNARNANAAAMCFAFSFLPQVLMPQQGFEAGVNAPLILSLPVFGLAIASLVCAFTALSHGGKYKSIGRRLGLPKGFKWLRNASEHDKSLVRQHLPDVQGEDSLPPLYRAVVESKDSGLSSEEISKRYSITEKTVSNILNLMANMPQASCREQIHSPANPLRSAEWTQEPEKQIRKKRLVVSVALIVCSVAIGSIFYYFPFSGPQISGRPIGFWIERLDDLDPSVSNEALEKLQYADAKHLKPARKKLSRLADEGSSTAASMIYERFGEVRPEWVVHYAKPGYLPTFARTEELHYALEPLERLSLEYPTVVKDALGKELMRLDSEMANEALKEWERENKAADKQAVEELWEKLFQ